MSTYTCRLSFISANPEEKKTNQCFKLTELLVGLKSNLYTHILTIKSLVDVTHKVAFPSTKFLMNATGL